MEKIILCLSVATLLLTDLSAQGMQGSSLFEEHGCALCHKKDNDTIGPSLSNIATIYAGKEMDLLTYLTGKGTPIVDPARASVMNPQLIKLSTMLEEDLHAISTYIINSNR